MSKYVMLRKNDLRGILHPTMKGVGKFVSSSEQILRNVALHHLAHPDFAELDVFLGQHMLLTLEQHFNPKFNLDYFPTPKPNLNHE